MDYEEVKIHTGDIQLDQFLKWANLVETGGQAKSLIQAGKVMVNGEIEKRRSTKIARGDLVKIEGEEKSYRVTGE